MYDYYVTETGEEPFAEWYRRLDQNAALSVERVLLRMSAGNLGDVKPVGHGVLERRIHIRSGYRIYFGKENDKLVILCGGTKRHQRKDIKQAKELWDDYKRRKNQGD